VKFHDFGPNYDFISARAGIQQFNADFRGFFLSTKNRPCASSVTSTAIASNTTSPISTSSRKYQQRPHTFDRRHQQVLLGNVYLQDFFFPGYTLEFVAAWNKDDSQPPL